MSVQSQRVGWAKVMLRTPIQRLLHGKEHREERQKALAAIDALADNEAIARAVAYARTLTESELVDACQSHGPEPTARKLRWIRAEMATDHPEVIIRLSREESDALFRFLVAYDLTKSLPDKDMEERFGNLFRQLPYPEGAIHRERPSNGDA